MSAAFAEWMAIFGLLVFVHFVADWVFQSHKTAMAKHADGKVRAVHCLIYTAFFVPVLVALVPRDGWPLAAIAALLLFLSHWTGDSYLPVYVWARWFRRIPLPAGWTSWKPEVLKALAGVPINLILFIVIDQLWHIAWLWPVVALVEVSRG
jgi:hypothetical protein